MTAARLVAVGIAALCFALALLVATTAYADSGGSTGGGITVAGSVYKAGGGTVGGTKGTLHDQYQVIPRGLSCDPGGNYCDPAKYNACLGWPRDDRNVWIASTVNLSTDGGLTWNRIESNRCLNFAVLEKIKTKLVPAQLVRENLIRLLPIPAWHRQPPHAQALVIKPVIVVADTPPTATFRVRLLDQPVTIQASVDWYDWSWGDGAPVTRTDVPGENYDSAECTPQDCSSYVNHAYQVLGVRHIVLSLIWHGRFRVGAGPWQAVPGIERTTSPPAPIRLVEARSVLVEH